MLSSYNVRVSMQSDADLAGLIAAGRLVKVTDCPKGLKGLTYGRAGDGAGSAGSPVAAGRGPRHTGTGLRAATRGVCGGVVGHT